CCLRHLVDFFPPQTTSKYSSISLAAYNSRGGTTMQAIQRISPCLWFDDQAEAAVAFYTGIFRNSRVLKVTHYGEAGKEIHGRKPGSVMSIAFELDGQSFTALNGGPLFQFSEAISF